MIIKLFKKLWNNLFPPKKQEFKKKKRPAAVKIALTCDSCGREFMAYPSQYPQLAFAQYNDGVMPLIYCNGTRFGCPTRDKKNYSKGTPVTEVVPVMPVGDFEFTEEELDKELRKI